MLPTILRVLGNKQFHTLFINLFEGQFDPTCMYQKALKFYIPFNLVIQLLEDYPRMCPNEIVKCVCKGVQCSVLIKAIILKLSTISDN